MKKSKLFTINTKNTLHLSFLITLFFAGNLMAQEFIKQTEKKIWLYSGVGSSITLDGTDENSIESIRIIDGGGGRGIDITSYSGNVKIGGKQLTTYSERMKVNSDIIALRSYRHSEGGKPVKVGIGTDTPDETLTVNGKIHAQGVRVDLVGWPDYVFKENYTLPTLLEVEQHIQEKGHLQNIPSATEVEEKGVELGEMDKKLLQKIEELTLYTIAQEKEIKELQQRIAKNDSVELRLARIEKLLGKN